MEPPRHPIRLAVDRGRVSILWLDDRGDAISTDISSLTSVLARALHTRIIETDEIAIQLSTKQLVSSLEVLRRIVDGPAIKALECRYERAAKRLRAVR